MMLIFILYMVLLVRCFIMHGYHVVLQLYACMIKDNKEHSNNKRLCYIGACVSFLSNKVVSPQGQDIIYP